MTAAGLPKMLAPEFGGRSQALIGLGRRHPDVHHRHIGAIGGHGGEQGIGVGHGRAYLLDIRPGTPAAARIRSFHPS